MILTDELQEIVDAMIEAKTWAKFIMKQDLVGPKYHFTPVEDRVVSKRLCEVASYLFKDKEYINLAAQYAFKLCKQNEINITVWPYHSGDFTMADQLKVMPSLHSSSYGSLSC